MSVETISTTLIDPNNPLLIANVVETEDMSKKGLVVLNPNGSNIFDDIKWDEIVPSFATLTDTYVFKFEWVVQSTIVVTYTDNTKDVLQLITKT